ncbi:unnamed protein product [Caenorhabditis brenneri]
MVTRTFPLLVLPYLAICNVLDLFNLNEFHKPLHDFRIQFSFLTKRTQRIASKKPNGKVEIILKAQQQPKFKVRINNSDNYKFGISGLSAFHRTRDWKRTRMCGKYILSKTTGNFTETFWKENLTGIEKVGAYLTGLLKSPITEIELLDEYQENDLMRVIDWVSSRQKTVQKCIFDVCSMPAKNLTYLLANLGITDHFYLPETIKVIPHPRRMGFNSYQWFTVEHLMNMNCQFVHVEDRNIQCKDLNRFLKHWQAGGCSSLRFWRLEMFHNGIDLTEITKGIEVKEVPYTLWRTYSGGRFLKPIKIRGGHQIKRNNGTIGTILIGRGEMFHFAVQPTAIGK